MDDTYAAVAEAAAAKKKARKASHTAAALPPPLPDEEADGARGINQVHMTSARGPRKGQQRFMQSAAFGSAGCREDSDIQQVFATIVKSLAAR